MLSCQDCEKYLYAFLDHALDVKESLDIQEHLFCCPPCAKRVDAERTLRTFVRQHATVAPLPETLKCGIIRQVIHAPRPQHWWTRLRVVWHLRDCAIGVAAAAVVLLVFSFLSAPSKSDDLMRQFVQDTSRAYRLYTTQRMPLEVASADDTVVTQWFNKHMDIPLKLPCITDAATKLLGGRLCRLFDRKSAALVYQRNGVDILLFAFPGGRISLPTKHMVRTKDGVFYVQNVSGRPVAMWQRGGMTYSITGDMDRDDLIRVATTINYR
ncbi:MAG TPA: zf-HC2 domain-containing protein [Candidatus Tectomicrobia bacterium]|jgi:anti-sigma factor RsiW